MSNVLPLDLQPFRHYTFHQWFIFFTSVKKHDWLNVFLRLDHFFNDCPAFRQAVEFLETRKPLTVATYRSNFRNFYRYLQEQQLLTPEDGFELFRQCPHDVKRYFYKFLEERAREVRNEQDIQAHITAWNFWRHFWGLGYIRKTDGPIQYAVTLKEYTQSRRTPKDGIPLVILQQLFVFLKETRNPMFKHLVFLLWDPMRPSEYIGLRRDDVRIKNYGVGCRTATVINRFQKTSSGNAYTTWTLTDDCTGFSIIQHLKRMKKATRNSFLHGLYGTEEQCLRQLSDLWTSAWKAFTVHVYNTRGWVVGHLKISLYSIRVTYFGINRVLNIDVKDMKSRVGHTNRSTTYRSYEFQAMITPGFNVDFDKKMSELFPSFDMDQDTPVEDYIHPTKREIQNRQVQLKHVQIVPLDFRNMKGDDWLLKTPFEIKKLSRPPKKRNRPRPRPTPQRLQTVPRRESVLSRHNDVFSPATYENILNKKKREIQRTKIRQKLLLERRARKRALKLHKQHLEEQKRLYEEEVRKLKRMESIENPTPTLASARPERMSQFPHDMIDYGSSLEDSDLTQNEPDIVDDVLVHDTLPPDEKTDNEDVFQPGAESSSDEEMPVYNAPESAQTFQVSEKVKQRPNVQAILRNAETLKKALEKRNKKQ